MAKESQRNLQNRELTEERGHKPAHQAAAVSPTAPKASGRGEAVLSAVRGHRCTAVMEKGEKEKMSVR